MKNKMQRLLVLAAAAVLVGFVSNTASAQGNFDPAQFRQGQIDRYRDRLGVKSEEDWTKLEPLIGKVIDARNAASGFGGGGGRGGRGGGGGNADQGGGRNRGPVLTAEEEALQKAIEDKAPEAEIKTLLAKVREARKAKQAANEAALDKAQEDLRKALSPRQEASAVLARLLK